MKFKSLITALLLSIFLAGPASALPIIWDLNGVPTAGSDTVDANNQTGAFTQVNFYAETSITQYDDNGTAGLNIGDSFIDNGTLVATGLVPGVDSELMGSFAGANWELTGVMTGFGGYVSGITEPSGGQTDTKIDYTYNTGTLNLYADGNPNYNHHSISDPAGRVPDEYLDDTGFGDGTKVATFEIIYGIGYAFLDFGGGDTENGGLGEFILQASYLAPGFWFDEANNDLSIYINPVQWFINLADYNVDDPIVTFGAALGGNPAYTDFLFKADVTHDGSMNFSTVPEPATLMLFGIGLLGLAGISRKKIS